MAHFDPGFPYGETDIVASFALCFRRSQVALCLGTIALEQTTPGMRSWGAFPDVPYNINGRLHCTDVDVRLGTLFAMNGHVTKVPISSRKAHADLRGKNIGIVTSRSNALVTGTQEFTTEERIIHPYGNSFSYAAESTLFRDWIDGKKTYSDLESHLPTAAVTGALARMIQSNGGGKQLKSISILRSQTGRRQRIYRTPSPTTIKRCSSRHIGKRSDGAPVQRWKGPFRSIYCIEICGRLPAENTNAAHRAPRLFSPSYSREGA
ncbi:hypothetical protein ACVWYH_005173 [Bradyrhizobium sp. GM24.11]